MSPTWADLGVDHAPDGDEWRAWMDQLSDHIDEWQGIPVTLGDDTPLTLHDRHPLKKILEPKTPDVEVLVDPRYDEHGGPERTGDLGADLLACIADSQGGERIVNGWHCARRNCHVYVYQRAGRAFVVTRRTPPDRAMDRLTMWLQTIGASDAWDLAAEAKAMDTLFGMLTDRQRRHYLLTGSFLETSPRSNVLYVFRKLRPTIAMSPRWRRLGPDSRPSPDNMRCLAVLCLHSIGYYNRSWGGCLVPSDDVLSHLIWMRADEAGFWKNANAHDPASPEAGL